MTAKQCSVDNSLAYIALYVIKSLEIIGNTEKVPYLNEGKWGFYCVKRGNKHYLVYIGMGENMEEYRTSTIESFYLNVLDLDTMEKVYKNYIQATRVINK